MLFHINKKTSLWLLVAGIILISSNMRAPLTSVGPLIGQIKNELLISNSIAGLITTAPLIAFALFSPFVPTLARRFGMEWILLFAVIMLTVGIFLRSLFELSFLFIGTIILGLAIASLNVLLPSFIKQEFPHKIGLMIGVYSISMNLFGAIAAGISIPIAHQSNYHFSLGIWAILGIISIFVWLPQVVFQQKKTVSRTMSTVTSPLWRSPIAWQVTIYMGLQSFMFYVSVAWLPEILISRGLSNETAGWALTVLQVALLPLTFIIPIIAGKMRDQRILVLIGGFSMLIGLFGLLVSNASTVFLWVIFLGIGIGCAFGLAMMFFGLRTRNATQAAQLSAMAQSIGYLLAAVGPIVFGFLFDTLHNWIIPIYLLIGAAVVLIVVGLGAAKERFVK
ncbi:CynX/NimT family MFS transporter [Kurthia sibirica]|uniref:MFS transporter n=1 Tax=Kurthia sibirica TaxID=202750 RepID=A0A2U3ALF4_9BACL|nr:MFS transporter [Kurthia sibirica]PWI25378.1 MFS transporter [Kurthia sibirica]GEK34605.1 MFS transporter [Kurthia sibirica]